MPSAFLDHLGTRTPHQLERLLRARPDLAEATPTTVAELARYASSRASVHAAVQSLDRVHLDVLERAALLGSHTLDPSLPDDVLCTLALIHPAGGLDGSSPTPQTDAAGNTAERPQAGPSPAPSERNGTQASWELAPGVAEALGRYPSGIGRPAATLRAHRETEVADGAKAIDEIAAHLADLPPRPAEVLAQFTRHPLGTVREAWRVPVPDQPEARPVDWLLARGILLPVDSRHVELPREAGLILHDGDPWAAHPSALPEPTGAAVSPRIRDNAALAAVPELVGDLVALRDELRRRPLAVLTAGGAGVRERRRLAAALELDQDRVDRLLGHAQLSGLIEQEEATGAWRPSAAPFESLDLPTAHGVLLHHWLSSDILPSAVGTPRADGSVIAALTDGVRVPDAVALRRAVLDLLRRVPQTAPTGEWLDRALAWLRPRLAGPLARHGRGLVRECADLGLTGAGAGTPLIDRLLDDGPSAVVSAVGKRLPPAVDTVVIQSDLTAVAHGPLSPAAAADLRLTADPEGRGAAATFRFDVTSLQRALDSGHDAESLRSLLERRCAGPLPQALDHLVDEAVRTHGNLRVMEADHVVTGRPDLVEATARSSALRGIDVHRVAPDVLVLRRRRSGPAGAAGRDPVRTAVLRAAHQVGVEPTVEPSAQAPQAKPVTGTPEELAVLFPAPAPSRPVPDPEHIRVLAERLAAPAHPGRKEAADA